MCQKHSLLLPIDNLGDLERPTRQALHSVVIVDPCSIGMCELYARTQLTKVLIGHLIASSQPTYKKQSTYMDYIQVS